MSGAGRAEEDRPPAGGDSHPERHGATDREGDKVQSGKPRGEQGERDRQRWEGKRKGSECETGRKRLTDAARERGTNQNQACQGPGPGWRGRRGWGVRGGTELPRGRSPPPRQPEEMGWESLTCCVGAPWPGRLGPFIEEAAVAAWQAAGGF